MCMDSVYLEEAMPQASTVKQRTNITLAAANLAAARELGLKVSAISDADFSEALRGSGAGLDRRERGGDIRAPHLDRGQRDTAG